MSEIGLSTQIDELLRALRQTTQGLIGSVVASSDGLVIAADLTKAVDEERFGAMAATILALGERTTSDFDHGQLKRILIEGNHGFMVVMSVSKKATLCTAAQSGAKLGMVFYQMEQTAEAIRKMMS
jgi:predicted regulator of Ras-like GTPase activity (Roadblock/LC7/MglB family)